MKVTIVSRKFIKPSSNDPTQTPNHPPTYKLSFFDQLAPEGHIPILYFYRCDDPKTVDGKIERLEKSLSEILTLYYPLAGRFLKDDFLVDCSDQGVEFSVAKVDVELMEFLDGDQGVPKKLEHVNRLVPWHVACDASFATTPMVAIQVTTFQCGGLAICVHTSHIIADGSTATSFVRAWATTSRLGIEKVIRPSFSIPSLFPSRDPSTIVKYSGPSYITRAKYLTRQLVFDAATIAALRTKATTNSTGGPATTDRPPSKVNVVISTLWKAIVFAARANHQGQLRPSAIGLSVNLRGRTAKPTLDSSFGNVYLESLIGCTAEQSEMELNQFMSLVRQALKNTLSIIEKVSNVDEIFSAVSGFLDQVRKSEMDDKLDMLGCTSFCGFPIYETDFGWGEPCKVSSVCLPVNVVFLLDTKCGTGVEAWVNLNESYMIELEKDPEIAALINSTNKGCF